MKSTTTTIPASIADSAARFADALGAAPVFVRFRAAEQAVADDADLQEKLVEYRRLATRAQGYERDGREFSGSDAIRFGTLQAELEANPLLTARQEATGALVELLREANRTISDRIGLDFAANAAPRTSCCG